jgi:hypothetical protein
MTNASNAGYCVALSIVALAALLPPTAPAEDGAGCEKFAWPLARERAWFAASDKASVTAGDTLSNLPKGAFVVRLHPASQASFALPPEREPRSDGWFGAALSFPAVERTGIYQVTLSDDAWVDVIQDGRYVRSVGSSGRSDCPGLRKSVRMELGLSPFILQLSGVASDAIVIAISPRE